MKSGSTRVESAGPPPVMMSGTAKTFMATITLITITSSSRGLEQGQGDVSELIPAVRAVNLGGFVVSLGNGLKAGEKDHHVVGCGAPDADEDDRPQRPSAAAKPRNRVDADPPQDRVHDPVLVIHEGPHHGIHNRRHDDGHEGRGAKEVLRPDLPVEQHGQGKGQDPDRNAAEHHIGDRDARGVQKERVLNEIDEIGEPDEPGRPDQVVFVEADIERLKHRKETKDDNDGERRQEDRIGKEGLFRSDVQAKSASGQRLGRCRRSRISPWWASPQGPLRDSPILRPTRMLKNSSSPRLLKKA